MLPKKNPKADLSKNSTTYFLIGLVLILFLTWRGIELKTYERDVELDRLSVMNDEDEEEVEETVIESTETDQEEIIEIEEIEVEEEVEDVEVPFAIIENIPVFPGCEKVSKKRQRDCFQEKINKHIRKNFRYPEIAQEMGIQGRVYVSFIIGVDGRVIMVQPRGPDKNLEKEARRIIENLPQMIPGKQRGKAVRVPYSIPITFKLQ
ncbi:MAG: energy transducer TonB [Flavobacteriaceae bacterium]|jgi:protein TonB|nr:energy transducer TonB [Flavobacteriaceae bacterium]